MCGCARVEAISASRRKRCSAVELDARVLGLAQHLDGEAARQADVGRLVDDAHPALGDHPLQAIGAVQQAADSGRAYGAGGALRGHYQRSLLQVPDYGFTDSATTDWKCASTLVARSSMNCGATGAWVVVVTVAGRSPLVAPSQP